MIGKTKITEKQKEVLKELVDFKCEGCRLHEDDIGKLQVHRIKRGHKGGTYVPHNVKMLCVSCHKAIHYGEFR